MSIFRSLKKKLAHDLLYYGEAIAGPQAESLKKKVEKISQLEAKYKKNKEVVQRLTGEISDLKAQIHLLTNVAEFQGNLNLPTSVEPPATDPDYSYDACMNRLKEIAPLAYEKWTGLFANNEDSYEDFPVDSCSVVGHRSAERFRQFILPYIKGPLLDIGCGPQPTPSYLRSFPSHLISGIDPLPPSEAPHPFQFVRGVAEFLPWPDISFQSVVIATSLDHVLLLDHCLDEIRRVLKPGGYFLNWVAFIDGAKKYDPFSPDVGPIDHWHLFHFDRDWYEDWVGKYFEIEEVCDIGGDSLYAWRKR